MCQFRVKLGKKKNTILVSDIDSKGSCTCVGAGGIREIPERPGKYCCLHKTAFPKQSLFSFYNKNNKWSLL